MKNSKILAKVDFFIVGAPKCGTTAMNEYLKRHPNIFIPNAKEIHYFGKDLNIENPRKKNNPYSLNLSLNEYHNYFSNAQSEQILGESSVFYLFSETAAKEIAEYNPDAKIIIMLRNPIDFLLSYHQDSLYNGNENIQKFEEALLAETARKKGNLIPKYNTLQKALYYSEIAKFSNQVQRYYDSFPEENIKVILFNDFVNDTNIVYNELLLFLGIHKKIETNFQTINPRRESKSKQFHFFLKHPPSILRKYSKKILSSQQRSRIYKYFIKLNSKPAVKQKTSSVIKQKIFEDLQEDYKKLEKIIGQDLSAWYENY